MTARCVEVTGYHAGPMMTRVDSYDVLFTECQACGRAWIIGTVSPERAEAVRRAVRAWEKRGRGQ